MSEKPIFSCQGCALCCSNLIVRGMSGLMLFPGEISLFPIKSIKPDLAVGTFYNDKTFKILTYQFTENVCPHLKDKKCMIYEKRPLSCKAYPVVDKLDGTNLDLAGECTEIRDLIKKFGEGFKGQVPREYMLAHLEKHKRLIAFSILLDISWRRWAFSLKTNTWELYKN